MDFLFGSKSQGKQNTYDGFDSLKLYCNIFNRKIAIDFTVGDYVCLNQDLITEPNLIQLRSPKDVKALVIEMNIKERETERLNSAEDITIAVKDNDTTFINIVKSDSRLFCRYIGNISSISPPLQIFNKDTPISVTDIVPGKYVRLRKGLRPSIPSNDYSSSFGHSYTPILEYFIILRPIENGKKVHVAVVERDTHKIIEASFYPYQLVISEKDTL